MNVLYAALVQAYQALQTVANNDPNATVRQHAQDVLDAISATQREDPQDVVALLVRIRNGFTSSTVTERLLAIDLVGDLIRELAP